MQLRILIGPSEVELHALLVGCMVPMGFIDDLGAVTTYAVWLKSNCHRYLDELGLEYETVTLDMRAGQHKAPEYLRINP